MLNTLFEWIIHYAYFGLFSLLMVGILGLPIPDETLLTFAGYLVFKGRLNLTLTIITAFLGSACGITLSYILGRTLGIYFVKKYGSKVHLTMDKLIVVQNWLDHSGKWVLIFGYFILGVRHIFAYAAGLSRMKLWIFAVFTYLGALIWSITFISLGYFLGEKWKPMVHKIHSHMMMISFIAIIIIIIYALLRNSRLLKISK